MDATVMRVSAARAARRMLLGGAVALAGTMGAAAWAQAPASAPAASAPGEGPLMGRGAWGGMHYGMGHGMAPGMGSGTGHGMMRGGSGMGGPMMLLGSPQRIDRAVDRMLDGLDASAEQRSQIKQIAQSAASDLKAQFKSGRELRERALKLFAAPTIDSNAVEALRQQMLAQHDTASKRVMQALLDVGQVLKPEQRAKFVERIEMRSAERRDRMQRMQRQPAGK